MRKIIPGVSDDDRELMRRLLPMECKYKPKQETLDKLFDIGNTIILQKNDTLINIGDDDPHLYILIDGMLRCWFWNKGKEDTDLFSTIPTVFFNYHSYYGGEGSFYCVEACCESRVIKILKRDFENLIAESHDFTRWFLSLSQSQLYYFERKSRLRVGDMKTRYLAMLKDNPNILNDMPLQTIASYLKITPQYLSKIRQSINLSD